jgi:hypothetical protein
MNNFFKGIKKTILGEKPDGFYFDAFKEKLSQYSDTIKAKDWLNKNTARIKALFENHSLRDFILEPFKGVFNTPLREMDHQIYSVITQVAVINAVLAGLPGRMGVGLYVVMAMEGWMAFRIARHVGIDIKTTSDIWKYFGALAASVGIIFYLFRTLLGFGFSLFSLVPGINPLIFAEFFVTNLVGILFLFGFKEVKAGRSFQIPKRMMLEAITLSKDLFAHQYGILKNVLSSENIKVVAQRLADYLKGDLPVDMRLINGEGFATVAMVYLISGQSEKLEGPIGEAFLKAIRLRWSAQLGPDASQTEIATLFRGYETDQMEGAINTIKGKMFEIMVTDAENQDGDEWVAAMHSDESYSGSDIIFSNQETGVQLEVSLKAASVANENIIESALAKYPDMPIMTTDELARLYEGDARIFGSGITNEELVNITEENVEKLLEIMVPVSQQEVVVSGVTVGTASALWPFVMAYLRGRISRESLNMVFRHVLGEAGLSLASRLTYATIFGPIFAWYLLARGVKGLVVMAEPSNTVLIEYNRR